MSFFGFDKKNVPEQPPSLDSKMALRLEVAKRLLHRAYDVADNCEGICDNPVFRQHVIALGHTITAAVAAICFNELRYSNDPPFYADIWQRHESWFDDLASFLSYWFVSHEMAPDDPNRAVLTPELLSVAATVYTASNRAHRMIDRYVGLMREPAELRDRQILMTFAGSNDLEVRGLVFAFIVNETLGGPSLEGNTYLDNNKAAAIDPSYALWFRSWMSELQIGLIGLYREGARGTSDISLDAYVAATDAAFAKATDVVMQVFG